MSGRWVAAAAEPLFAQANLIEAVAALDLSRRDRIGQHVIAGSSGGLGSAYGSVIGSGSPATTTRASGPVGESWPWSYGIAASS